MPSLSELHEIYLRQLDSTLGESELLLQREGGLDGELKTSGSMCEAFARQTLSDFIVPRHFRLVSGFIATPRLLREKCNLPQCDILIVDPGVPPLLRFKDTGIEVVPREAVIGIIEVKRTITKASLYQVGDRGATGALAHINHLLETLGERQSIKTDLELNRGNRHVLRHNHSSSTPMLGVVGLQHSGIDFSTGVRDLINQSDSPIDFVWAFDGAAVVPAFQKDGALLFYSHVARPTSQTWLKISNGLFGNASSDYYKMYSNAEPCWAPLTRTFGLNRTQVFSKIVGIVSLMLSRVVALPMAENQINDYYLRD